MMWGHNSLIYLADMRRQGLSASKIGLLMGVTKNSIIGAWSRHRARIGLLNSDEIDAQLKARTDAIIAKAEATYSRALDRRAA